MNEASKTTTNSSVSSEAVWTNFKVRHFFILKIHVIGVFNNDPSFDNLDHHIHN